jgi:hypothetical protein
MVAPLLCAVSLGRGAVYASLAGVFIGSVYLYFKLPGTPWQSNFWSLFPRSCALVGMLAWGYLVDTGIRLGWDLTRPRQASHDRAVLGPTEAGPDAGRRT